MKKLTTDERGFFSLVHKAVYANPFSDRRARIDLEIAGLYPKQPVQEPLDMAIKEVHKKITGLEKRAAANITLYGEKDKGLLTSSFLFEMFHTFTDDFDDLILNQIKAGPTSVSVDFSEKAISLLCGWGFTQKDAIHYFALSYQFRRAFYFIQKNIKGRCPSIKRLRESLWNNVFTHDLSLYNRFLWNRMDDFSTLILGETGTGKGTAAMAIGRSGFIPFDLKKNRFKESFTRSFISLNLSQFPEALIESELFGHKKGAFTGAVEDHQGIFDRCSPHGAIFLDEIGEVSEHVQIKLLQVIQERQFSPVGSHETKTFKGRVIAATNRHMQNGPGIGFLRDDFFYRLCSDIIIVPPLSKRLSEDPDELYDLLDITISRILGNPSAEISALMADRILKSPGKQYLWPGNVRELEQCVRSILLKQTYKGTDSKIKKDLGTRLKQGITNGNLSARELMTGYCKMLYNTHNTFESVARITGLDRRTVKKHIDDAKDCFE